MPKIIYVAAFAFLAICCKNTNSEKTTKTKDMEQTKTSKVVIIPDIENYIGESVKSFGSINENRKEQLHALAGYIEKKIKSGSEINLNFICTHNSRRSHLSQLWAQAASYFYGIPKVHCYSGGTEATAFNPRAVKAMKKAGFAISAKDDTSNPVYSVLISKDKAPVEAFSKKFSDEFNPQENFAAIMTCSHADEACPFVPGADGRFAIPYEDPKVADNTPEEEAKYDERCRQISVEMLYLFSQVHI